MSETNSLVKVLTDYYNEDPEAFQLPKGRPSLERGRKFLDFLKETAGDLEDTSGYGLGDLLISCLDTLTNKEIVEMAEGFAR